MAIVAVTYTYSGDDDQLAQIRPAHREFLGKLYVQGTLRASGPAVLGPGGQDSGTAGALLLIEADNAQAALAILDEDPFQTAGLISSRDAIEWKVIFGPWS